MFSVATVKVSFAIVEAFGVATWFVERLVKVGVAIVDSKFGWGLNSDFVKFLKNLTYSKITTGFSFNFSSINFVAFSASLFKVPHFMVNSTATAVEVVRIIEESQLGKCCINRISYRNPRL